MLFREWKKGRVPMADNRNQKQCAEVGCEEHAKIRGFCSLHSRHEICCVEGCPNRIWLYGRCKRCFEGLDPEMYQQLKDVPQAERQKMLERLSQPPERPKWQYENPEGELELMRLNAEIETPNDETKGRD
jgi:hypothetical protein